MYKDPYVWDRLNSFALVSYIPEPLAGFLDNLRQELVPNTFLPAHVTILPPRAVCSNPESAWHLIETLAPRLEPFEVELTDVEVFPVTDVIYVNVGKGSEQLIEMHEALNIDGLCCQETYRYHPHVTLAQDLQPDELDELVRVARARWAEFSSAKTFRVEKVVFVQNTRRNCWTDLGACTLGQSDARVVGDLTGLLAR
jgi:2'-5' RNA ligase